MKALITGGLGTIGSCLAASLFRDGAEVIIYDNMEIGSLDNLKLYLSQNEIDDIKIIRKDILDKESIAIAISQCNIVFHLAATLGTLNVVSQPCRMIQVNTSGTQVVADVCRAKEIPLVIMSTSMVYGTNPKGAVAETDDLFVGGKVDVGLWWYAVSKLADEAYANSLMLEDRSAQVMVIRPFNVVAPVQNHLVGFVFPRFFRSALFGDPILVYGDGSQQRTFTWAQDFVDCLIALVKRDKWRQTFNIGGTESISILELAEMVNRVSGSKSIIKHLDPQQLFNGHFVEIPKRIPDVTKLNNAIGFVPETSIETIVEHFHKFYDRHSNSSMPDSSFF